MFSITRSRALVAPGRGFDARPLAAPWWRSMVGHALTAGARRWRIRASARSFSGAVLVVGFGNCGAAVAFAAGWSWWVGCALALRRRSSPAGTLWAVSVPVAWPGRFQAGRGSTAGGAGGHTWWVSG